MDANLPTAEQADLARDYMTNQIHVPAFVEKLASHNITPKSDAELTQLLQLGAVLHEAEAQGRTKQAGENPFLTAVLERFKPAQAVDTDAHVKQSADGLISKQELAKTAALVYAHVANGGELAPTE